MKGHRCPARAIRHTHRVEFFDGGHQWPPAELTFRAFGWMELVAMKEGRRSRDADLAARVLADDMAHARAFEEHGMLTDAERSYGIDRLDSYAGLVDVAEAERRMRRSKQTLVSRAPASSKNAPTGVSATRPTLSAMMTRLSAEDPPLVPELRGRLNLDSLVKASRGDGYEAASAAVRSRSSGCSSRRSFVSCRTDTTRAPRSSKDLRLDEVGPLPLLIPPANDTILRDRAEQHESHEDGIRRPGLPMRERTCESAGKSARRPSRHGSSR